MTQELRKLAKAAKGWLIRPSIVQETEDDILKLGDTSEDGEFYELIEIDCENYSQPSRPLAEFIAAANPAAILELLDRLEKAEKDSARLDWLEQNLFNRENVDWITGKVSNTHNMWVTFAPVGVQGSARRIIDSAMEASK